MMKVLVVGGAGYIGSHVVLDLLEKGHHVTIFDNLSTGREENIVSGAHFVKGDMLEDDDLERLLATSSFDAVMHFAALKAAGESMVEPERYARHNIRGSLNLLDHTLRHRNRYFVFSSSAAVYGNPEYYPMDEAHPKIPANFYGFTKLQFEHQLEWFSRLRDFRYAALRYFNAAGYDAGGRITGMEINAQNLVPVVMETAVGKRAQLDIFGDDFDTGDGTGIRDYIHVTDLATAHTRALDYLAEADENLVVNLGTGSGFSVKEVLAAARHITGRPIPAVVTSRRKGDPPAVYASADRAREILKWEPRHSSLENMLNTTWAVYRKYG